jgi:hypothetical protein
MPWTLPTTHALTGEDLLVQVNTDTRAQAEALAAARGLIVHDCYPSGRGYLKPVRVVAWIWFAFFSALTLPLYLLAASGLMIDASTPRGLARYVPALIMLVLAAPGYMLAKLSTAALRGPPPDPRRGFDVIPAPPDMK